MDSVIIYTDGACSGNPGIGGWGAVLKFSDFEKELSGADLNTTNNRMELSAVIQSLESLGDGRHAVSIYTDSQYVKLGITEWIKSWVKNGWKNSQKQDVKNKDLWVRLLELSQKHDVSWNWVRGHNGHPENERVDSLARSACLSLKLKA